MILRSEYSFREVFGSCAEVAARCPERAVIADWGTWGHVDWEKAMKAAGKVAVFGSRFIVRDELTREKADVEDEVIAFARSAAGLRALYERVELAHDVAHFYWRPRLRPVEIEHPDLILVSRRHMPGAFRLRTPGDPGEDKPMDFGSTENWFPLPEDRSAWELSLGAGAWRTAEPQHIMAEAELGLWVPRAAILRGASILKDVDAISLPRAANIKFPVEDADKELSRLCWVEFDSRGLTGDTYRERLALELAMIAEKKFADYFLVISDLLIWAKQRMLVGPARGSSCGSLVCWLTRITEVDPLQYELLFERFVDTNRLDLPDIDIDFPDHGRAAIMEYLSEKYGPSHFAHIGTVMRYKPKSALTDVAKALKVPPFELDAFKDVLIERSSGDSRVNSCLEDSFNEFDSGRKLLEKYPQLLIASRLEGHARQSGVHAAGLIVTNSPVREYCGVGRERTAMIEKPGAERLNLLKIDALGLRTLSVLEAAADAAGIKYQDFYRFPEHEPRAFAVLNDEKFSGIFQFEGNALQSLARQMKFESINDLAAITALARPGPLATGAATSWILRRMGREAVSYIDDALIDLTQDTYGEILYQEQVMMVTRKLGKFSWKDTSSIRKLMSNRRGDEAFSRFETIFLQGCRENGIPDDKALRIWKGINSFGSWAFNKSHAVAYGLLSYWCCYMKGVYPLAYALGSLRNAKDDEQSMMILRELIREGMKYVPFDIEKSDVDWSVQDGTLYGGLTGIKGIGEKTARDIIARKFNGVKLTKRQQTLIGTPSKWADPFPTKRRFKDFYDNPREHNIVTGAVSELSELDEPGTYIVIGQLLAKNLRDMNEPQLVQKRGGKVIAGAETAFLYFNIQDDTNKILCRVNRYRFEKWGKKIVDELPIGRWLLVKGDKFGEYQMLDVIAWRDLGD